MTENIVVVKCALSRRNVAIQSGDALASAARHAALQRGITLDDLDLPPLSYPFKLATSKFKLFIL